MLSTHASVAYARVTLISVSYKAWFMERDAEGAGGVSRAVCATRTGAIGKRAARPSSASSAAPECCLGSPFPCDGHSVVLRGVWLGIQEGGRYMRAGDPAARAKHEEWPPSEEAMAEQVRDALFGWVCQLSAGGVAGEDAAGGAGGGAVAPRDTKDTEVFAVIRRAIRGRLEESPEDADCGEAWAFGTAGAQMRVVPSCEDRPQPRACMEGELKLALVDIWLRFPPGSAEAARRIAQAVDGWQLRNSFRPTVPRDSYLPCAVDVVTLSEQSLARRSTSVLAGSPHVRARSCCSASRTVCHGRSLRRYRRPSTAWCLWCAVSQACRYCSDAAALGYRIRRD